MTYILIVHNITYSRNDVKAAPTTRRRYQMEKKNVCSKELLNPTI